MLCLIPARNGSKRLPGKNFRELGGKPLWQWTYEAALGSKCFDDIWFCTNPEGATKLIGTEPEHLKILVQEHPLHRDECKDVEWVSDALSKLGHSEFAILRPTSPFRGPETIRRAKDQWDRIKHEYDSMRAIRKATETPWKMWRYAEDNHEIDPITSVAAKKHLHSFPTQLLEEAWIQTAGLEMAWTKTVLEKGTIAGDRVAGFVMQGAEADDINTPSDWAKAIVDLMEPQERPIWRTTSV